MVTRLSAQARALAANECGLERAPCRTTWKYPQLHAALLQQLAACVCILVCLQSTCLAKWDAFPGSDLGAEVPQPAPLQTTPVSSSPGWKCPMLSADLVKKWAQDSIIIITVSDILVYEHFGPNFIRNMRQLNITHALYGAADSRTAALVSKHGMPCFRVDPADQEDDKSGHYKWGSPHWSSMTWLKVKTVQRVVALGFNVIHSDLDAAWMRDPLPYFKQHMDHADMLISSDALRSHNSVGVDAPEKIPQHDTNFNTGVYMICNTQGAKALLKGWLGIQAVFQGNDQTGFYKFIREDKSVTHNGSRFSVLNQTAWIGALPVQSFMHSYTLQIMRLHKVMQVQPYEVHMVWGHSHREGKIHRMREEMVSNDDPHYFEDRRLLLVDLEVPQVPEGFTNWTDGEKMIQVHIREVNAQLQQLVSAFGLAMALNRTLVLPKMLCFCYKNWYGLDKCRIPGDKVSVFPLTCPASQIMNVERLYKQIKAGPYELRFREHSFLENPRTPSWVKENQRWLLAGRPGCGMCVAEGKHHDGNTQLVVPEQLDDVQLQELASGPTHSTVLLRVPNGPRLFKGFRDKGVQEQFHQAMRELQVKWCCRPKDDAKRLNKTADELLTMLPPHLQLT